MAVECTAKVAKDWHSSKYMAKRARYLLAHPDEQIPSDVTFLVGDGSSEPQKTLRCHKFMLAMVSPMFQAMFYGSLPETEDNIKVPDVTPTAFQNMLRYAYGDEVALDADCMEEAIDTLYCAKKYLISKLERSCRDHIQLQISLGSDPCVVFQKAPQMDEENLAVLALARIAMHTTEIIHEDGFSRLSFDCVQRIIDYDRLNVDETDMYRGVHRWVEHNVGAVTGSAWRDAFGSLLYAIRFPLFTAVELADGPVTDGVLTAEEISSVFQFLFAHIKPALPFLTMPRRPLAAPLFCCFHVVTGFARPRLEGFVSNEMYLVARPDLAPQSCAFLEQLVESKLHIRIASHDNEHPGRTVPLPAAVMEERSVLSYSVKGACWFEWDMYVGTACHVRIGVGRKPHPCHGAVFGMVLGNMSETPVPFCAWDDKLIQGVAKFRFHVF